MTHTTDQEDVANAPEPTSPRTGTMDDPNTAGASRNGAELEEQQAQGSLSESSSVNTVREPGTARVSHLHISIPKRSTDGERETVDADVTKGTKGMQIEGSTNGVQSPPDETEASQLSATNLKRPSIPHRPVSPTFLPQPSWISHRTASPNGAFSPLASPTPGREFFGQNPFGYEYTESPRSPLNWRQTFEEAVRASSGAASPVVAGGMVHTPTPAPVGFEGRSRQGSVAEGYFVPRMGSEGSATLAVGGAVNAGLAGESDQRKRISDAFGQDDDAVEQEAASTGTNGTSGHTLQIPEGESETLHGLGLGTPLDRSPSESAEGFESVPLDSGNSDNGESSISDLPPLPSSARSTSFAAHSSLGTPDQSHHSSRRVSVSSVASQGKGHARSPMPREVSVGLWGEVQRPSSPVIIPNGSAKVGNTKSPPSKDASASSSRRPSVVTDEVTPKVTHTPRLAPPAIPHDIDPALIAALSKPGASSLALAETGDPFPSRRPSSTSASHKRRSLFGRASSDHSTAVTPTPTVQTPASHFMHDASPIAHTAGPSMLDQVRSQTRMVHLPPKSREEDQHHLERWKTMMEESRVAEEKRRELMEQKRLAKERRLAEDMPVWEAEILNPANSNAREGGDAWSTRIRNNPKLRDMWFRGVPSHLRGKAWSLAIGNDLALSKDAYRQYHARASRAIQAERFPKDVLDNIDHDAAGTLPVIKIFQPGSPMHDELKDLLCAWYISRLDEGQGYMPDIHHLAGMLLMTMNLPQAFIALRNLLNRPCLRAFYSGVTEEVEAYYRIFDNLQGELFPKIYANCKHLGIRLPSSYFTTLFIHQLSFEAATRVWDVIMLEGDSHIFRIALAILAILEPRLYFPDRTEIISILEGSNQASLSIVARERERARQKGLPYISDIDGVLTCLGVTEDLIFDTLQRDEWKESRFDRLCQRELPDD